MIIERKHDALEISLEQGERAALHLIFEKMLFAYQMPPEELDPRVESEWYQTSLNRKSGFTAAEYAEWRDLLHILRGEHVPLLEKWLQILNGTEGHLVWTIPLDEADPLIMITNDYRLHRAAEADITEADMEMPVEEISSEDKKMALYEIDSLATLGGALIQSITNIPDEPLNESEHDET